MQGEEFIPLEEHIDLDMLATDLNEVLASEDYAFDVSDATVREALPAFFAAFKGIKR